MPKSHSMPLSNDRAGTTRGDNVLLAAFHTVSGLHLGAGLYEARVVIPQWSNVLSIPTLHQLARAQTLPEPQVRALASQWVRRDRIRLAMGLGGWLASLSVLSQPHTPRPEGTPP